MSVLFNLFLLFYNLLYSVLKKFILFYAHILKKYLNDQTSQNLSLLKWIQLRNQNIHNLPELSIAQKRIWIHASSGEIEYAKAIIREFKLRHPELSIVVSYSSASAPKLFKNIESFVDLFFPLPWDQTNNNIILINKLRPDLFMFSRSDFWPNLISQLHKLNIPMTAISVFPHLNYTSLNWFYFLTHQFTYINAVSAEVTQTLNQKFKFKRPVVLIKDTRFDQVCWRLANNHPVVSQLQINSQKRITFGSTWPADESILLEALPFLIAHNFQIFWAPHDPLRVPHLQKMIQTQFSQYQTALLTEIMSTHIDMNTTPVIIIDQVGLLADLYKYSQWAFVGGSFVKKVHSVMEPLCAGNHVFVGPYYKNNPEAIEFKKLGFVHEITTHHDIIQTMNKYSNLIPNNETLLKHIQTVTGGSLITVLQVEQLMHLSTLTTD